mgnify:CR=1 FL=1
MNFFQRWKNTLDASIRSLSVGQRTFAVIAFCGLIVSAGILVYQALTLGTINMPVAGGTYREGIVGSPRFISPLYAQSDVEKQLVNVVYNGLVQYRGNELVDDLAAEIVVSDDKKTYTFTLRDNISFHDGVSMDAKDVVFTLEALRDRDILASNSTSIWTRLKVEQQNNRTLIIKLEQPYPNLLHDLTVGILPEHIWSVIPPENYHLSSYNTEPIGSDAYKISRTVLEQNDSLLSITLKRARHSAAPENNKGYLNTIILNFYENEDELLTNYHQESIDGFTMLMRKPEEVVGINTTTISDSIYTSDLIGLFVNTQDPSSTLRTPEARNLLNKIMVYQRMIDKESIHADESIDWHRFFFSDDTLPPEVIGEQIKSSINSNWTYSEQYDTLVSKSGSTPFAFTITTSNAPQFITQAEAVQKALLEYKIRADMRIVSENELLEYVIPERDYEVLLFGTGLPNPSSLSSFWHSSQRNHPGLNITGYANSRVDTILDQLITSTIPKNQQDFAENAIREIMQESPVIPLGYKQYYHHHRNITVPNPTTTVRHISDRWNTIHSWYAWTQPVWNRFIPSNDESS